MSADPVPLLGPRRNLCLEQIMLSCHHKYRKYVGCVLLHGNVLKGRAVSCDVGDN